MGSSILIGSSISSERPRPLRERGLHSLRQCAKYGIYTVIDLHAAPGGELNPKTVLSRDDGL